MKHAIFFPLYNIHSDLVKAAIGVKDNRSVEHFFLNAGVKIRMIGKKKCVTYDDIVSVVSMKKPPVLRYDAQSELSRMIDEL